MAIHEDRLQEILHAIRAIVGHLINLPEQAMEQMRIKVDEVFHTPEPVAPVETVVPHD